MKTKSLFLLCFIILHSSFILSTHAQGTVFTYQGFLAENGGPYTGNVEFQPTLWDAASGGSPVATNSPVMVIVGVTNGLFVLPLDFGANFPGAARWLQLEVRTTIGQFNTLSPRQPLSPAPYAITANHLSGTLPTAQLSGALPSANLAGTYSGAVTLNNAANSFTGNGAGLTNLNAAQLAAGTVPDARLAANVARTNQVWLLGGNAGTTPGTHFLGTTDNQPLELKVNGLRALRLEDNGDSAIDSGTTPDGAPNLIGGSPRNFVGSGVVGATIAGGGATNYGGAAYTNSVLSDFGVVGGGRRNTIAANSLSATIAGGIGNDIGTNSHFSAIGGGDNNNIAPNSPWATIAGGLNNDIGTNSDLSAIGGGNNNNIAANSSSATIAGGNANGIAADSIWATIAGGNANGIAADSFCATIAGGGVNNIGTNSYYSAIGGGNNNKIAANSSYATIAGGNRNDIGTNSIVSAIGGGDNNKIAANALYATIPGGDSNSATNYAFAAGRRAKANHTGAFVWGDSTLADFASTADNQFAIRASGGVLLSGSTPNLAFGTTTRQMLNLYGVEYGIGVQDFTVYQRTAATGGNGFAWFKGGSHTNAQNNPGAGGTVLMTLGSGGLTVNGTFVSASDRNVKQDFADVNSRAVLEKVAQLPIQTWAYQNDPHTKHLGPMAQDFYAAFGVGPDDKHITTVDESGVALAAIQGLNQKLEAGSQKSEDRIQKLETENAELKQRLEKLEQLMNQNNRGAQ